jgi:hypothetical protein
MDKGTLVDQAKADGARFVRALDATGFPVTAALWIFDPQAEDWRLVIATPLIEAKGPKEVYGVLRAALHELQPEVVFGLNDVWVVSPKEPLIQLMGSLVNTGPSIVGRMFEKNVLNGVLLPDAYIYRLNRLLPAGHTS